jgi:hypothetical protein
MEVDAMEEEEINDGAAEEVEMEDKDYTELRNKVDKPKKRAAGKAGPELSSEEEPMSQFSTVRSRKKSKKLITDDVKQSSNRDQNTNKSWNHNQAKEGIEQGSMQQAESEAQNVENEGTNNGKEDLGERVKSNRNEKFSDLCFKIYEKGPFSIHLKVKRPDTPLVEGKKEKKWEQFDIFSVMTKYKIGFQSISQYSWFIWEVTFSERIEANKVLDSPIIQKEGLSAYIPRYMVIKKGVIKDVPEVMELGNLTQQLNSDNQNKHLSRLLTQSDLI